MADRLEEGEVALEAVLDRLAALAPEPTARARRAIGVALAGVRASIWPGVAWRASRLTNTGCPVELSWSSRDPAIRWTAEVAGPETPEGARLDAAVAVLGRLGVAPPALAGRAPRPDGPLRFGAWVGGRHDRDGDRYKLYLETSGEAGARFAAGAVPAAVRAALPARVQWRMIGCESGSETVEVYGRVLRLEGWELARLLSACGLEAEPVGGLIAGLLGRAGDAAPLPGASGLSLAVRSSGSIAGAAWFAFARPLLGGDEAVARSVRALARAYGWDAALYAAILGDDLATGRHGLLGVGIAPGGALWLQLGLRP